MLVIFTPSFLSVWNQMPWLNLRIVLFSRDFLHVLLRYFSGKSETLSIDFYENCSDFS